MTFYNWDWRMPRPQAPGNYQTMVLPDSSQHVQQFAKSKVSTQPQFNFQQMKVRCLANQQIPTVQTHGFNKHHFPHPSYVPSYECYGYTNQPTKINDSVEMMGADVQFSNQLAGQAGDTFQNNEPREWIDWSELRVEEVPSVNEQREIESPVATSVIENLGNNCSEWEDWTEVNVKEEPDEIDKSSIKKITELVNLIPLEEKVDDNTLMKEITMGECESVELVLQEKEKDDKSTIKKISSEEWGTIDLVSSEEDPESTEESAQQKEKTLEGGGNEKFKCEHCPYKTNWKGNITKHVISRHTAQEEIKWFECFHCSYKGKTKEYLRWHIGSAHEQFIKWYECPHCPYKSKMKTSRDDHIISKHTEVENIKWFKCDKCPYKGKFRRQFKHHMMIQHASENEIKWFKCEYCPYKSKLGKNVKKHTLRRHSDSDKIQWFRCDKCPYEVRTKKAFDNHILCHSEGGQLIRNAKNGVMEVPVIGKNHCFKKVALDNGVAVDCSFKCTQCPFKTHKTEEFRRHKLWEQKLYKLRLEKYK